MHLANFGCEMCASHIYTYGLCLNTLLIFSPRVPRTPKTCTKTVKKSTDTQQYICELMGTFSEIFEISEESCVAEYPAAAS